MALPQLTPEQRKEALAKAAEARAARTGLLNQVRAREKTVADVLADDSDAAKKLKVVQLLKALPGWGPKTIEKFMAEKEIAINRRVGGLSERQRQAIAAATA